MKRTIPIALLALCAAGVAQAQQPAMPDTARVRLDTLKTYRLGEVIVRGEHDATVGSTTVQRIAAAKIIASDAPTADRLAPIMPATRIQTNSRGEAILYMRNAGERQTAIFLDGALINIPWDNRLDMSLIPMNSIGGVTMSKGVASVLYGSNILGGAVEFVSQELSAPGFLTDVSLAGGDHGYYSVNAMHTGNLGKVNYIASANIMRRDALSFPDSSVFQVDGETPFLYNQANADGRTNTDSRIVNAYLRGELKLAENASIGLSGSLIDGSKGVAPEGHVSDARFWRYPDWRNLSVVLNGDAQFGGDNQWDLRGAIWTTSFAQTIDQYDDATYTTRNKSQEDEDLTLGSRVVVGYTIGDGDARITAAINALQSKHDQRDNDVDSTGTVIPAPTAEYKQQNVSGGLEAQIRITPELQGTVGVGYDRLSTPLTGDKPARDPFSDWSGTVGVSWKLSNEVTARASAGRRTRFPTMRELFGEALRRFLVNPDLKPEDAVLFDAGLEGAGDAGTWAITAFGSNVSNTIDQRNIDTLGGRKRQRINLPGSNTYGAELVGTLNILQPLHLDGHFTYMHTRATVKGSDGADSTSYLSEKPEYVGTVAVSYNFPFGLIPAVELQLTGEAFTLNDENRFVSLGSSAVLNARLAYQMVIPGIEGVSTLFVRMNNIANTAVLPQLGLPAPGREFQAGLRASF
ncbi:MAG: TonB-dependent receptor [Chlorobi bacterium]|nr:MAG: TonB-dependent receptor [Chlorobi bacterium OLB7]MBK8910475.1 TonB-dependent receptor [Chlorobiota bacterium]MBX7216953.1 TonB-dependent receptor [Candidatus Kapabacteria bacterium]